MHPRLHPKVPYLRAFLRRHTYQYPYLALRLGSGHPSCSLLRDSFLIFGKILPRSRRITLVILLVFLLLVSAGAYPDLYASALHVLHRNGILSFFNTDFGFWVMSSHWLLVPNAKCYRRDSAHAVNGVLLESAWVCQGIICSLKGVVSTSCLEFYQVPVFDFK